MDIPNCQIDVIIKVNRKMFFHSDNFIVFRIFMYFYFIYLLVSLFLSIWAGQLSGHYNRTILDRIQQNHLCLSNDWDSNCRPWLSKVLAPPITQNHAVVFNVSVKFYEQKLNQWFWLSWQSGRFRQQRFCGSNQAIAKFILTICSRQLY